jgi:signal transduction histidine kinase
VEGSAYHPTIEVKVSYAPGEEEVRIDISDNGMGMSPEVKERLFEVFFTTKPAGQGTGLGMSITRDIIVKNHGGRLLFESEPNVGSTFTFIIPVKPVK